MAYGFNLNKKLVIDTIRSPWVYEYNLAQNLALLSNDVSVIRRFYQVEIQKYFKDVWLNMQAVDKFMGQYIQGQAFSYFGIIPMIVQGKVNLVASNGFICKSDDTEIDDVLNKVKDEADLENLFVEGVYWESGIGDFAYRVSYHPEISDEPIIDIIQPQHLEVNYCHGKVKSFVVKEVSKEDPNYELREIHHKNEDGYACIDYRFWVDGKYVNPEDESLIKICMTKFSQEIDLTPIIFPFKEFDIIFKKNANCNQLYRGERGVPDIQGMDTIEDALTESFSDLIDAIRKGGVKEYVSDQLIPQDEAGNDMRLNHFNKTIITTKGSSTPGTSENLWRVTQANINNQAYIQTIETLMSVAINKAGLAPTTLGLTGLESINSSAESQDAREKTSMRTREICLNSWELTLKELLNRYLQVKDYIEDKVVYDYTDLISISFNEYTNPTLENVTDLLAKQVQSGIKSQFTAIKELNDGQNDEQVESEFLQIMAERGQPVITEPVENSDSLKNANLENSNSTNANLVATDAESSDFINAKLENSNSIKG